MTFPLTYREIIKVDEKGVVIEVIQVILSLYTDLNYFIENSLLNTFVQFVYSTTSMEEI